VATSTLSLPTNFNPNHAPTAAEFAQILAAISQAHGTWLWKTSDQTITSSTTLTNDNDLATALAASKTYIFIARLFVFGAAAGDIKVAFTFPASTTFNAFGGLGIITGSTTVSTSADLEAHAYPSTGTSPTSSLAFGVPDTNGVMIDVSGQLVTSSTTGNLQLQWAQNASSGTGTTVKAGSWLLVKQM